MTCTRAYSSFRLILFRFLKFFCLQNLGLFNMSILFVTILLCPIIFLKASGDGPIVQTNYGDLQGFTIDLSNGQKSNIFLKIPFALPPVGNMRLEKPREPEKWKDTYDATSFGPACIQHGRHTGFTDVSEDCLHLNIFSPVEKPKSKDGYPVLVWVHGGGWVSGGAYAHGYKPLAERFVPHGIVVVTVQYRLGPLGFASTGDERFAGNLGLWDMRAALRYLHKNIANFGGDPKWITVWGGSAGSASVSMMTMSPSTRELFHQAIQVSASPFAEWTTSNRVIAETEKLAIELGCDKVWDKSVELKKCFKNKTIDEIQDACEKIGTSRYDLNIVLFGPRIDAEFFPKDYPDLIKEASKKPTLLGLSSEEGGFFTILGLARSLNQIYIPKNEFTKFSRAKLIKFIKTVVAPEEVFKTKAEDIQKRIISFYVDKQVPENVDYKFWLQRYTQLFSDVAFNIPILKEVMLKKDAGWPMWLYLWNHTNPDNFEKDLPIKGAFHGIEYPYLFDVFLTGKFEFNEDDRFVQKLFVDAIASFVKNGKPDTNEVIWPPVDTNNPFGHLLVEREPKIGDKFFIDRLNFWLLLTKNYDFDIIRGIHKTTLQSKDEL